MMKSSPKHIFIVLFCLIAGSGFAQDVHLTQYYTTPTLINPGATGVFDGIFRFAMNYRNQWTTVNSNYQTTAIDFEHSFFKKRKASNFLGVGLNIVSDKAGIGALKRLAFNLNTAYHLQINDHTLGAGIHAGFMQRSVDQSALTWDSQYDQGIGEYNPNLSSQEKFVNSVGYLDFGAGLHWKYTMSKSANISAGGGIFHISQPNGNFDLSDSRSTLPMKFTSHGAGQFVSAGDLAYFPHFMVAFQGPSKEITLGTNVRYMLNESSKYTGIVKGNAVYFGADYRFGDAFILLIGVELSDWEVGISYDMNTSGFSVATGGVGGFEISLVWVKSN